MPESMLQQTDPGAAYRAQKDEIDRAVARAVTSGWYILGEETAAFEAEFAAYLGIEHTVSCANGTDAIILALRALDVGRGCAVATVSHTATATLAAIEAAGATPILLDIDDCYTMDITDLEEAEELARKQDLRLAAIAPVHIYGQAADLDAIMAFANARGIPVMEDCAQAHGATWRGRVAGTLGAISSFSFYPTKNLGALGDGGAIATPNGDLAKRVARLRQYGWDEARISREPGVNSRLDVVQAAILRAKLKRLATNTLRRQAIADAYRAGLESLEIGLPRVREHATHVYHQFVIEVEDRDRVKGELAKRGIATAIHYAPPAHHHPAYRSRLALVGGALKRTDAACERILSLPMYPELSDAQVEHVVNAVRYVVG